MPSKRPPRQTANWASRRDELAALIADGASVADLCERYGCARGSMTSTLHRLGLRIRPDVVLAARKASALVLNSNPEMRARMDAARSAVYRARPELRERSSKASKEYWAREGTRERMSAVIKELAKAPEQIEARRRGRRSLTAKMMAWCPPEFRAEYEALKRNASAADAKRMVLASITRDEIAKRNAAARAPKVRRSFEEELALAQAGAIKIIELSATSRPFHLAAAGA